MLGLFTKIEYWRYAIHDSPGDAPVLAEGDAVVDLASR